MIDERPDVSIIIPVYNGEKYLISALESILNQSFQSFELIAVDDCSDDRTPDILEEYSRKDSRIKVIRNKVNSGLPSSLNIGFSKAGGRYFTWTSDDNMYEKNAIEILFRSINENRCDFVWANYYKINEVGRISGKTDYQNYQLNELLTENIIGACFLYKREIHQKLGGYRKNKFLVEDYDFWLRAYKYGYQFQFVNQVLYRYRLHSKSLTGCFNKDALKRAVRLRLSNLMFADTQEDKVRICKKLISDYEMLGNKFGSRVFQLLLNVIKNNNRGKSET